MKVNKNIPNILCIFRIVMVPFILLFLLDNPVVAGIAPWVRTLCAGILFLLAMLTDLFDGKIARRYDLVSDLGKFLDPIADKMLVLSVLCAFLGRGEITVAPVVLILMREFCVSTLRMVAAGKGDVISAKLWGKVKTTIQGVLLGAVFVDRCIVQAKGLQTDAVPKVLVWIIALVTLVSAIPYFKGAKKYLG